MAEDPIPPPPPPRILIPSGQDWVYISDGGEQIAYKVKDGEIVTSEAHVAAILGAIPGSSLKPEPPAPKAKPKPGEEK